jgi:hypothetical protein
MSAIPKIYSDAACTQELAIDGSSNYTFNIGPVNGIDGNVGGSAQSQFWIKNTGTEVYQAAVLTETADSSTRASYSLDGTTFNATTVSFGDIAINAVSTFYVKVTVAASSTNGRFTLSAQLSGESI